MPTWVWIVIAVLGVVGTSWFQYWYSTRIDPDGIVPPDLTDVAEDEMEEYE